MRRTLALAVLLAAATAAGQTEQGSTENGQGAITPPLTRRAPLGGFSPPSGERREPAPPRATDPDSVRAIHASPAQPIDRATGSSAPPPAPVPQPAPMPPPAPPVVPPQMWYPPPPASYPWYPPPYPAPYPVYPPPQPRPVAPPEPPPPPEATAAVTTPPEPPYTGPYPARASWSLQLESAQGVATGEFQNALLAGHIDYAFAERLKFGGYLAIANLKGKDRRVSALLPCALVTYEKPPAPGGSLSIPIQLATGYLTQNGPVARLSGGLAWAVGRRTDLVFTAGPMVWVTRDDMLLSVDGAIELRFRAGRSASGDSSAAARP